MAVRVLDIGEITTTQAMQWMYCEKFHRGERFTNSDNQCARLALVQMGGIRIRRATTRGRPWIWRLSGEKKG
jgi:hypothetical protein